MKTFADYIAYLRENGLEQDAHFYETEVVTLLKMFGHDKPLEMNYEDVVPKLKEINNNLVDNLSSLYDSNEKWDVVLT